LQRKHRVLLKDYNVDSNDEASSTKSLSWIHGGDEKCETGDPNSSTHQKLIELGDITEVSWDESIPYIWKLLLEKWFDSARKEDITKAAEEDSSLPLWVVDDDGIML